MSLVVPSFSGGNMLANSSSSSAAGITSAGSGATAAMPFALNLVQSMGGGDTAKGTASPLLGNLASLLQGLLNAVQTTGEESVETQTEPGAELLQDLAKDMEKLDENISSDPAVLAALQGWLLQVSVLLPRSNAEGSAELTENLTGDLIDTSATLSPLARSSETIRFAVQDELNSLVNLIQEASAGGNEETVIKGAALLNSFTSLLAELPSPENQTKSKGITVADGAAIPSELPYSADSGNSPSDSGPSVPIPGNPLSQENESSVTGSRPSEARQQIGLDSSRVMTESEPIMTPDPVNRSSETTVVKGETAASFITVAGIETPEAEAVHLTPTKAAADISNVGSTEEPAAELAVAPAEPDVVTAGQLSLRAGITQPLKSEAPPVPVHQFAKEMEVFISGKLEIVKKGGVAEATITLFPENLGQVDVKITMQNGNLIAQFLTEYSGAKDMLEQQMSQLRSALQAQGLQVERLEVAQNSALLSQYNGQQGRQTASGGQQQGGRSKERREEIADAVLAAELNGEWKDWVEMGQQDTRNEGRGFSAKV